MSPYLRRPCATPEQARDRLLQEAKYLTEAGLMDLAKERQIDAVRLENYMRHCPSV
jgi:hypothetical protein